VRSPGSSRLARFHTNEMTGMLTSTAVAKFGSKSQPARGCKCASAESGHAIATKNADANCDSEWELSGAL
jgi:hypothetical protein